MKKTIEEVVTKEVYVCDICGGEISTMRMANYCYSFNVDLCGDCHHKLDKGVRKADKEQLINIINLADEKQ